jgi:hypothetical protein
MASLATALLDRLVERAIILKVKGQTYRTPPGQKRGKPHLREEALSSLFLRLPKPRA